MRNGAGQQRPRQRHPLRAAARRRLGVRAAAGAAAPGAARGDAARSPAGPVHVVSAHLDPRGPPGYAWLGVSGRARQAEYLLQQLAGRPGRPRRRPQPRPRPARAHLAAAARGGLRRRHPARGAELAAHVPRLAAAGAGLRAGARPARARGQRGRSSGWTRTRATAGRPSSARITTRCSRASSSDPERRPPRERAARRLAALVGLGAHAHRPGRPWSSVIGALFLPDWTAARLHAGHRSAGRARRSSSIAAASACSACRVYRGGEATVLQNGDAFFPAMLEAIRGARGLGELRGLHLRARRAGPPVHGRVHRAGARRRRGPPAGRLVRLVEAEKTASGGADARGRAGRVLPAAQRCGTWCGSTGGPTGAPS